MWKGRRAVHRQSRRWASAWSREQIAHRLRLEYPKGLAMRISHGIIYLALYIQRHGALRRELTAWLRSGRALCLPCERARNRGMSLLVEDIKIIERPEESQHRADQPWRHSLNQTASGKPGAVHFDTKQVSAIRYHDNLRILGWLNFY